MVYIYMYTANCENILKNQTKVPLVPPIGSRASYQLVPCHSNSQIPVTLKQNWLYKNSRPITRRVYESI